MRILRTFVAGLAAMLFAVAPVAAFAAAGVTADVRARITGTYTSTNALGSVTFSFDQNKLTQFTPGTAALKADKLFSDRRTVAASSSENLDLAGVLTDPFGATLTCVKVRWIYVAAASTNTNSVLVGGAASNAFLGPFADATDILTVQPGGTLLLTAPTAGWTVTASTGDLLKVANSSSGTGVTYDVVIGCTSA